MSTDRPQPPEDAGQSPYPPYMQPRRSGSGCSCLLGLGCGCLLGAVLTVLLCAGVLSYIGYEISDLIDLDKLGIAFEEAWSDDPQAVTRVTTELAEIELPRDYHPVGAFYYQIPFTTNEIRWVVYEIGDEQGVMMLGNLGPLRMDVEQVVQYFEDLLQEHDRLRDHTEQKRIEATETREMVIRGRPATFVFIRGVAEVDDEEKPFREVTGTFEGSSGPTIFFLHVDESAYDEDEVIGILESIR